jgi:hypothetical protein
MACCCSFTSLVALAPAVAGLVIAGGAIGTDETCGSGTAGAGMMAVWAVVQSVVLLVHFSFAAYLCVRFARPYTGRVGEDAAASGYSDDPDADYHTRLKFVLCNDPVAACYMLTALIFGFVWLIVGGVWGAGGPCFAGMAALLGWLFPLSWVMLVGGPVVFCCTAGMQSCDVLCDDMINSACGCFASAFAGLFMSPESLRLARERRRARNEPDIHTMPPPSSAHRKRPPMAAASGGGHPASPTHTESLPPPHMRRHAPPPAEPVAPVGAVATPTFIVPSGPGVPQGAGTASLPPHLRGTAESRPIGQWASAAVGQLLESVTARMARQPPSGGGGADKTMPGPAV